MLREKFTGRPGASRQLFLLRRRRSARASMARLGFRTVDEMVGRTDVLRRAAAMAHAKARTLDLVAVAARDRGPGDRASHAAAFGASRSTCRTRSIAKLLELVEPALEHGERGRARRVTIRNVAPSRRRDDLRRDRAAPRRGGTSRPTPSCCVCADRPDRALARSPRAG